jgi:antitoxin component YwqK of YwqJK toxin-antitoxin module
MYYAGRDIKNLVFLLLITSLSYAQNVTDNQGRKQGTWKKVDENGKLKYEGQFKDNIPTGTFKHYHSNGKLKAVSNYYLNGEATHTTLYSVEGVREAEGKYLHQQKDSIWKYYDISGEKLVSQESYANNQKHGAFITYNKDEKPLEITRFSKGKKDGRWEVYYPNGKPKLITKYNQGELDSTYTSYFEEGSKKIEGQFSNASREGNWFYYNANGSIQKQEMYKDGKLSKTVYWNGTFTNYYTDDVPKETFSYENGKLNGDFIEYYFNGTWVKKQKTNDEGVMETYDVYEGQTMKSVCKYLEGLKVMCTTYKENGKVDKTEKFK